MVAQVRAFVRVARRRSDASTGGLEQQGNNIAGDEDTRIREGFNTRVLGPKGDHDVGKCEIEAGRDECRGNR